MRAFLLSHRAGIEHARATPDVDSCIGDIVGYVMTVPFAGRVRPGVGKLCAHNPASSHAASLLQASQAMIKRIRGGRSRVAGTPERPDRGKRSDVDDSERPLVEEWKRRIVEERLGNATQRRLLDHEPRVGPALLDEIKIVSRIGRLRLLWKRGRTN